MAVPTSNISLTSIYEEANGVGTMGTNVSFATLASCSYFDGPNGSNFISYNAWGQGTMTGGNRIYGLTGLSSDYSFQNFSGKTYFYDNSTFQVTLNVTNNKTNPPPFPPPPVDNAVNVNVELWGEAFSYQYLSGGGMAQAPGTYGPSSVSQTNDPIIYRGYWKVTVGGAGPSFAGGSANISINGTSKVSGGSIPSGPSGTTFDSTTYGTEDVASYGGFTGLYFEVTVN
jgi:hypothetical protein